MCVFSGWQLLDMPPHLVGSPVLWRVVSAAAEAATADLEAEAAAPRERARQEALENNLAWRSEREHHEAVWLARRRAQLTEGFARSRSHSRAPSPERRSRTCSWERRRRRKRSRAVSPRR